MNSKLILTLAAMLAVTGSASAQILLTGTGYTENFNTVGSGLPTGVTVFTGATSSTLGTAATLTTAPTSWGTTTGGFRNGASYLAGLGASAATQAAFADRALTLLQTGALGDPGISTVFTISNTTGFQSFTLTMDLMMLAVQARSTTFTIDYRIGGAGAFTAIGTYTDPGVFGNTPFAFNFGNTLDNQSGTVEVRVSALSASTGANSRDTVGIDNFSLTYTAIPEPSAIALGALGLAGIMALRRRRN